MPQFRTGDIPLERNAMECVTVFERRFHPVKSIETTCHIRGKRGGTKRRIMDSKNVYAFRGNIARKVFMFRTCSPFSIRAFHVNRIGGVFPPLRYEKVSRITGRELHYRTPNPFNPSFRVPDSLFFNTALPYRNRSYPPVPPDTERNMFERQDTAHGSGQSRTV
jgi:hypothetical protein